MHVMDAVMARRSVRKFTPEGLERSVIEKLMDAAVRAPNAANSQNWAFGVIQDAGRLREYSSRIKEDLLAHVDRFEWLARYKEMLSDPEYHIFYNAPALVIIFSKPGGIMAKENCCLAAENLMLAACDMGLGTCWIGFSIEVLNSPEIKKDLGIPADYTAVAPIIVGRPAEESPASQREAPEVLFWK